VEEEIKQGTGDLRACGPSTFTSVDSFKNHGEPVLCREPLCAAVNTNAVNEIDQIEIVECKENVHENANEKKSIEIDLSKEKIESRTTIESVTVEIDPVVIAEPVNIAAPINTAKPINVARPVNTGDSYEKIDFLDQYTICVMQ
jgi:Zn ribbon nucleic-acid-binding protein